MFVHRFEIARVVTDLEHAHAFVLEHKFVVFRSGYKSIQGIGLAGASGRVHGIGRLRKLDDNRAEAMVAAVHGFVDILIGLVSSASRPVGGFVHRTILTLNRDDS